jgi:hypothetical protein
MAACESVAIFDHVRRTLVAKIIGLTGVLAGGLSVGKVTHSYRNHSHTTMFS